MYFYQTEISCVEKMCGKIPQYFSTPRTPSANAIIPWSMMIYLNGKHICGGTLVNDLWVATSMSCMKTYL